MKNSLPPISAHWAQSAAATSLVGVVPGDDPVASGADGSPGTQGLSLLGRCLTLSEWRSPWCSDADLYTSLKRNVAAIWLNSMVSGTDNR